jgi:hypothetical protein
MDLKGSRKIILTAMFGAIIVLAPNMSDTQLNLLQSLIVAAFGGNIVEHLAGGLNRGKISGGTADSPVRAVRPVTAAGQAPVGSRNEH